MLFTWNYFLTSWLYCIRFYLQSNNQWPEYKQEAQWRSASLTCHLTALRLKKLKRLGNVAQSRWWFYGRHYEWQWHKCQFNWKYCLNLSKFISICCFAQISPFSNSYFDFVYNIQLNCHLSKSKSLLSVKQIEPYNSFSYKVYNYKSCCNCLSVLYFCPTCFCFSLQIVYTVTSVTWHFIHELYVFKITT